MSDVGVFNAVSPIGKNEIDRNRFNELARKMIQEENLTGYPFKNVSELIYCKSSSFVG